MSNEEDSDDDNNGDVNPFKRKSSWVPASNRDDALETYIKAVSKDIFDVPRRPSNRKKDNLTLQERQALRSLSLRTDIVIKRADKGSATVVMSREDYISKVMNHLDNREHYQLLDDDPTADFSREIKNVLTDMYNRCSIDKETMLSLHNNDARASRFYILPKIHKLGCPGRPIVSSCGAPTEGISRFVEFHLGSLVRQIPSYIKDTTDFLLKLRTLPNLPPGTILATLDVTALYTNIPHSEGIEACRLALNSRQVLQPPTDDLVNLIKLILNKNNFIFNDQHYLQVHGTAMGTRMAPAYANIFMGRLESILLERATNKPTVWWRYIDDVFTVWSHGEGCFKQFLEEINSMHPSIKFTAEWSDKSVSFLDVKISIGDNGNINTDLYTKPTDTHQYLHRRSCHPYRCMSTIPYSQALRLRRICSEDDNYLFRTKELATFLTNRGYEKSEVQQQIDRATNIERLQTLKASNRKTLERVPMVVTYHPDLPSLNKILRKHLPILHVSEKMRKAVPHPPLVSYRRPRNLNDLLVRALLKSPQQLHKGTHQCNRPRCKTCMHIRTETKFGSTVTGETFLAKVTATCKTANVIYLMECRKCKKQYVGETENPLHLRINGHRSDFHRKLPDKPVAVHFNSPGHSFEDMTVMVIERMQLSDSAKRKLRESYWIHTLRSLSPHGLNLGS